MGTKFAVTVQDSKISYTKNNRGFSLPTGNIGIPVNDAFQGGYNPKYNPFPRVKKSTIEIKETMECFIDLNSSMNVIFFITIPIL